MLHSKLSTWRFLVTVSKWINPRKVAVPQRFSPRGKRLNHHASKIFPTIFHPSGKNIDCISSFSLSSHLWKYENTFDYTNFRPALHLFISAKCPIYKIRQIANINKVILNFNIDGIASSWHYFEPVSIRDVFVIPSQTADIEYFTVDFFFTRKDNLFYVSWMCENHKNLSFQCDNIVDLKL